MYFCLYYILSPILLSHFKRKISKVDKISFVHLMNISYMNQLSGIAIFIVFVSEMNCECLGLQKKINFQENFSLRNSLKWLA